MPIPAKYLADFEEEGIYHVFNRTNNKELLFLSDENRFYFLRQYKKYITPLADTYCWCLLPNHFHILLKVKSEKDIADTLHHVMEKVAIETKFLERIASVSVLVEHAFKRLFQSYALSFNRMHKRQGNLFYKPFKRVRIEKDSHFTMAVIYIHANAAKHRLVKDFRQYTWSSWHTYLSTEPTDIKREEVVQWFGGQQHFVAVHLGMAEYYYNSEVGIE